MTRCRKFVRSHAGLAALLIVLTLALRAIVPAGFMPSFSSGTLSITVCSGNSHQPIEVAIPGLNGDAGHKEAQSPCAFADLALPWLGAVDPILLAIALAFALAAAFVSAPAFRLHRERHAWPPLRGPPLTA